MTNTRKFDEIRDEATRAAMYELWGSARDGIREINASLELLDARVNDLVTRIGQLEARLDAVLRQLGRR